MKTISILVSIYFMTVQVDCLELSRSFSLPMHFVDAMGNLDSIEIGYDTTATDSIDEFLGEENIIDVPADSGLDVRTSITSLGYTKNIPPRFQSKRQLISENCEKHTRTFAYSLIRIDVMAANWPITANWDSAAFQSNCWDVAIFTGTAPGGWWDVIGQSGLYQTFMDREDSITFGSNHTPGGSSLFMYSLSGVTIPTYFVIFADSAILGSSGVQEGKYLPSFHFHRSSKEEILLAPYPVNRLRLYNLEGKIVKSNYHEQELYISEIKAGIYFLELFSKTNQRALQKVIVNP